MTVQLGESQCPCNVDAHRPVPTEPLEHVIEGGGVPWDQARPSIPELAGFLGINPNTVARAIEDLRRSGYRPLRLSEAPEPSSIPGAPTRHGAPA